MADLDAFGSVEALTHLDLVTEKARCSSPPGAAGQDQENLCEADKNQENKPFRAESRKVDQKQEQHIEVFGTAEKTAYLVPLAPVLVPSARLSLSNSKDVDACFENRLDLSLPTPVTESKKVEARDDRDLHKTSIIEVGSVEEQKAYRSINVQGIANHDNPNFPYTESSSDHKTATSIENLDIPAGEVVHSEKMLPRTTNDVPSKLSVKPTFLAKNIPDASKSDPGESLIKRRSVAVSSSTSLARIPTIYPQSSSASRLRMAHNIAKYSIGTEKLISDGEASSACGHYFGSDDGSSQSAGSEMVGAGQSSSVSMRTLASLRAEIALLKNQNRKLTSEMNHVIGKATASTKFVKEVCHMIRLKDSEI